MSFTSYKQEGATLAADLVNTLGSVSGNDYMPDTGSFREFLEEHGFEGERPTESDLTAIRKLRKRLKDAFFAEDEAGTVEVLNSLLQKSKARPRMTGHDGHWHWHYVDPDAPLTDRVTVVSAMGLATLLAEMGPERLGICHADDCAAVFVDVSKNRSRRYCDDTCSTRVNVAAHRSRKAKAKTA